MRLGWFLIGTETDLIPVYRPVSLVGRFSDGVRGRYGGLGVVSGRGGFRVSVRAREGDRQLGGLSPGL
jgi:hypothetical protein